MVTDNNSVSSAGERKALERVYLINIMHNNFDRVFGYGTMGARTTAMGGSRIMYVNYTGSP